MLCPVTQVENVSVFKNCVDILTNNIYIFVITTYCTFYVMYARLTFSN